MARVNCKGQDASEEQARAGLAWAYTRYLTDPGIARLQAIAQGARKGLWADADPVPPWDWRKSKKTAQQHIPRRTIDQPTGAVLP